MEWFIKEYGAWIVSFLALAWTIYSSVQKRKDDKSEIAAADYTQIQLKHITESADLRRELRAMLKEATDAKERIESEYKAILRATEHEYDVKMNSLQDRIEGQSKAVLEMKRREKELEDSLGDIREKQNARIDIEAEIKEQNRLLKEEVVILRQSNREIIQMYETQLGEKDKEVRKLKENIASQGRAINKLKEILEQNGITAMVET